MPHPLLIYRQTQRLTRRTLAARIGCSTKTLMRWEKGQYRPRLVFALKASRMTGLPIEALEDPSVTVLQVAA